MQRQVRLQQVTDFLRGLGLRFHPLTECNICDIVSDTLAECVEFSDLAFIESGLFDGHYISFCGWKEFHSKPYVFLTDAFTGKFLGGQLQNRSSL